jgi:hypothetical protein
MLYIIYGNYKYDHEFNTIQIPDPNSGVKSYVQRVAKFYMAPYYKTELDLEKIMLYFMHQYYTWYNMNLAELPNVDMKYIVANCSELLTSPTYNSESKGTTLIRFMHTKHIYNAIKKDANEKEELIKELYYRAAIND